MICSSRSSSSNVGTKTNSKIQRGGAPLVAISLQATCTASQCGWVCADGYDDCNGNAADGCEIDVANDVANCGSCDNDCPPVDHGTPGCASGTCAPLSSRCQAPSGVWRSRPIRSRCGG